MKKRNRKLRKVLLALSCMLTLVAVTVGATLAYLTDTAEVVNTFTVGNVDIDLNETDVDENGSTKENGYHLVPGQTYTKDPTVTIKANSEPSYVRMLVTVEDYADLERICLWASSQQITGYMSNVGGAVIEPSNVGSVVALDKFTTNMSADWKCVLIKRDFDNSRCVYEFRYKEPTEKKEADYPLNPLFQAIQIPGWMTNNMLKALSAGYAGAPHFTYYGDFGVYDASLENQAFGNPFKITVRAEAIQAAGFDNADEAWAAFDAQMN